MSNFSAKTNSLILSTKLLFDVFLKKDYEFDNVSVMKITAPSRNTFNEYSTPIQLGLKSSDIPEYVKEVGL